MKRSIAQGAHDVVLAVDSSKLGGRAVAVGIDWDRVDVLVTELDPGDERLTPVPRPSPGCCDRSTARRRAAMRVPARR